jgi:hypothetical protein
MPRIVISYRRLDSDAITGRIFDRLVAHYDRDSVFRDVDNIPLGVDFRDHIATMLDESNIVLVVVGPRWVGGRGAQNRLGNPADPVRVEVETALRKGIPVIPILVDRAGMPKVEQLPDSLKDFVYRAGLRVDTGADFDHHVDRLIRAMDGILAKTGPASQDKPHATAAPEMVPSRDSQPAKAGVKPNARGSPVVETLHPSVQGLEAKSPILLGSTDGTTVDEPEAARTPVGPELGRPADETASAAEGSGGPSNLADREEPKQPNGDSAVTQKFFNFADEFTIWARRELNEKFGVLISTASQARHELRKHGYRVEHSILAGTT